MLTEAMAKRITLDFLKTESASGVILAAAALAAIALANSPWAGAYFSFIHEPFTIQLGAFTETLPVLDWVKEGLMAIFFFVVGLEIKYEIVRGELANPRRLALPVIAALGGMVGPALDEPLARYGRALGQAFQIADDVLDSAVDEATAGKSVGQQRCTLRGVLDPGAG